MDEYRPEALRAAWYWVDTDLNIEPGTDGTAGGLLVDPDIGLCLYLMRFDASTRLEAQIGRALALQSQLLPEAAGRAQKHDRLGAWRIAIHWLLDPAHENTWLEQATALRNDTAHMEEIPVDYLVHRHGWPAACRAHGFPRLLLATRALLNRRSDAVERWASADEAARSALQELPAGLSGAVELQVAREVLDWLAANSASREPKQPATPTELERLQPLIIRNLRNIQELDLVLGGETAGARIIHGPNGTGKSNLFEGLSLALSGASRRYCRFLKDGDITTRRDDVNYVKDYLCPFGKDAQPTVDSAAGNAKRSLEMAAPGVARERLRALDGSLLPQEAAGEFLEMDADALGSLALGAYSGLAQDANDYLERRLAAARAKKNEVLGRWGLSTQISRVNTAREKIVRGILERELSRPQPQSSWLEGLMQSAPDLQEEIAHIVEDWSTWESRRQADSSHLASDSPGSLTDQAEDALTELIEGYDGLVRSTAEVFEKLSNLARAVAPEVRGKAGAWSFWLEQQQSSGPPQSAELDAKTRARNDLEQEIALVRVRGDKLRARSEHLETVARFLAQHWGQDHGDECPSCGSDTRKLYEKDMQDRLDDVRADNDRDLADARKQYRVLADRLKLIDDDMRKLGAARCPLSPDQQLQVTDALAPLLPPDSELRVVLSNREKRELLLNLATRLSGIPPAPSVSTAPARNRAQRIGEQLVAEIRQIDAALADPAAWEVVERRAKRALAAVVQEHLPGTIGRVWYELTMSITPARWQLPELPRLHTEAVRRKTRMSVRLGSQERPLYARHLLNEAEAHALGLAWFFLRYLTAGRFRYALIAMDDPAQEMDQPTFRDLCRLWETLLRLHRVREMPLDLLVLLHQDERALDAVRATDGTLHRLGWNRTVPGWLRVIRLRAGPSRYPSPAVVLQPSAPAETA